MAGVDGRRWTSHASGRVRCDASALVRCRRAAAFRSLTVGPVSSARCCGLVAMPRRRRFAGEVAVSRDENDGKGPNHFQFYFFF
jgi:hypothetical protein